MTAHDRGWGTPGCTSSQMTRVVVAGMVTSPPYFPLNVRDEVAPLFTELCRWLVAERRRLGLPALTCSGGYNKRLVRGSTTNWSNHSWALAGDFNVAQNPMQDALRTDMPPGTSTKAKSLGMVWGGNYSGRKDPMHFEFVGTPADARRLVAGLEAPQEEIDMTPEQSRKLDDMDRRTAVLERLLTEKTPTSLNPKATATPIEFWRWTQGDAFAAMNGVRALLAEQAGLRAALFALSASPDLSVEQITKAAQDGAAKALDARDAARAQTTAGS